MANSFSQVTLHFVFASRNREALILPNFKERLHAYITGIVENKKHKMLAINSEPDHLHMLIGFATLESMADLVRDVKSDSALFVNHNQLSRFRFQWQEGYGVFSYSRSQRDSVIRYIMGQHEHHKKISFREEYINLLRDFEVEFDNRFLFDFFS